MADSESVAAVKFDVELGKDGIKKQVESAGFDIQSKLGKAFQDVEKRGTKCINNVAKRGTVGITKLGSTFDRTASKMHSTASKLGATIAAALSVGATIAFGKSCIELGSDLTEVQNVVDTVSPNMTAKVDDWSKKAAESFGLSETMAKKYTGTFGAMSKAFGFTESQAYSMSTALAGLAGDVASFYNITQDEAYTKLKSVFSGETETLKDLGIVMTQNALDAYAMANGYGKVTSAMSEQEKVELRLAFVTGQLSAAQGDFAKTSDQWANQVRILQLNFESLKATIGQGFINLFAPVLKVINTVIAKLSVLAAKFKALTEFLTGKSSSSNESQINATAAGAADAEENLNAASGAADKLANATKKAAKASRSLMGFDKINKLNEKSSGNSSSSGSGKGSGASTGINADVAITPEVKIDSSKVDKKVKAFAKKLKKAFKTGDFTEIGSIVAGKIKTALDKIKWSKIKASTKKVAKSVATFLNGFFGKKDLWSTVGKTIAEALNTAVLGLNTFFKTFKWKTVATALATTINSFIKKTDFKEIGATIGNGISGVCEFIVTAVKKIKWGKVAGAVKDTLSGAFKNIKWGPVLKVVAGALTLKLAGLGAKIGLAKIKDGFGAWVKDKLFAGLKEKFAGKAVTEGVEKAAGGAVEGAVSKGVGAAGSSAKILAKVGKFAGAIGGCLAAAIGGWKVGNWIYEAITGEDTSDIDWSDLTCFKEYPAAFKEMGKDIASWWDEHVTDPVVGWIDKLVAAVKKAKSKIVGAFGKIGDWFKEKHNGIVETFKGIPEKFKTWFTNAYTNVKNAFSGIKDWFKGKYDGIVSVFGGIAEKFKTWFTNAYTNVKNAFSGIKDWFKGKYDGIVDTFKEIPSKFKTWFSDAYTNVKGEIGSLPDYISGLKDKISTKFKDFGTKAGNAFANTVISAVNNMITSVQKTINGAIKLLNGAIGIIKKLPGCKNISDIKEVTLPQITKKDFRAQGGYVKANTPRLAVVGDNRHQGEYIAPEGMLMNMAKQAAQMSGNAGMTSEVIELLKQILELLKKLDLDVYMDGEKVTKKIVSIINAHTRGNGGRCEII